MKRNALAPCRPVDDARVAWLPPWLTSLPPAQVDQTIMTCEYCRVPIWVGPRNKALAEAGTATLACYTCARPYVDTTRVELVNVHPGKPNRPRRGPAR